MRRRQLILLRIRGTLTTTRRLSLMLPIHVLMKLRFLNRYRLGPRIGPAPRTVQHLSPFNRDLVPSLDHHKHKNHKNLWNKARQVRILCFSCISLMSTFGLSCACVSHIDFLCVVRVCTSMSQPLHDAFTAGRTGYLAKSTQPHELAINRAGYVHPNCELYNLCMVRAIAGFV